MLRFDRELIVVLQAKEQQIVIGEMFDISHSPHSTVTSLFPISSGRPTRSARRETSRTRSNSPLSMAGRRRRPLPNSFRCRLQGRRCSSPDRPNSKGCGPCQSRPVIKIRPPHPDPMCKTRDVGHARARVRVVRIQIRSMAPAKSVPFIRFWLATSALEKFVRFARCQTRPGADARCISPPSLAQIFHSFRRRLAVGLEPTRPGSQHVYGQPDDGRFFRGQRPAFNTRKFPRVCI